MRCWILLAFAVAAAGQAPEWCSAPNPEFQKLERAAVQDDWFTVYRLRPDTFAIYEPRQNQLAISYLLLGSNRALLFDSGLGMGRIDRVVRALTKLPVSVLNSHTHFDHIGGNHAFEDIYAVDSEYTRRNASGIPNSRVRSQLNPSEYCPPLPDGVSQETFATKPFHIAHTVSDGDTIDLGGRRLQVIMTPGHTPDSLCLIDRGNRLLLTGDTFYPGPLYLFAPETDLAAYERSIARLTALAPEVDHLLPGHNFPDSDPKLLGAVGRALAAIRAGEAKGESVRGRVSYKFDGFSILLAAPK